MNKSMDAMLEAPVLFWKNTFLCLVSKAGETQWEFQFVLSAGGSVNSHGLLPESQRIIRRRYQLQSFFWQHLHLKKKSNGKRLMSQSFYFKRKIEKKRHQRCMYRVKQGIKDGAVIGNFWILLRMCWLNHSCVLSKMNHCWYFPMSCKGIFWK